MLKKIWQIFFFIIILSGVAIIQSSFVFNLPAAFSQINLIVIVLVFTLFFFGFRPALYAAVVLGFWLDLFSFYFFGLHILLFLATVIFANWVLSAWLTNRSLYSFLLLIFIATAVYDFALALLFFLSGASLGTFFLWQGSFWLGLFYQVIWSGLAGLLMFNLASALTRRFQPFFLETK
jgi:hypothetical protein